MSTWLGLPLLTWGLRKKIHNRYELLLRPVLGFFFSILLLFVFSTKVPDHSTIIGIASKKTII